MRVAPQLRNMSAVLCLDSHIINARVARQVSFVRICHKPLAQHCRGSERYFAVLGHGSRSARSGRNLQRCASKQESSASGASCVRSEHMARDSHREHGFSGCDAIEAYSGVSASTIRYPNVVCPFLSKVLSSVLGDHGASLPTRDAPSALTPDYRNARPQGRATSPPSGR